PTFPERLIDVSHTVEHGLVTYKGLPAPIICDYLSREASREIYAPGTEFNIGKIEMVANTGTYVDSPFHRFADGKDLSDLPLSSLADLSRPAHTILLGSEIPIVEHLTNLQSLPDQGFRFFAVPVKVKGFGTFPVRVFGVLEK